MQKILRIEEGTFKHDHKKLEWESYDGFKIITDKQTIKIGISNTTNCCESFGCIVTNDDTKEFIDSKILNISITDAALNNKKIEELGDLDSGGVMFVNIETNNGLLQFAAYNAHNGYYSHEAVLISQELNETENL